MALRVLIIAGSAGIRGVLAEIVAQDPGLEVMGTAADPFAGARRIEDEIPDVIILDADTPRMDGLTFLRKLMAQYPLPVVIISSVIDAASPAATEILEAGAMDVIGLPKAGARAHILASADSIRKKLKSAVQRHLRSPAQSPSQTVSPKLTADAILPPPNRRAKVSPTEPVVCIGASTGGTESLRVVLEALPRDCPGIVPAHARTVHSDLRPPPRLVVPNLRQGSRTQRPGAAGSRADRTGEPAHAAQPAG